LRSECDAAETGDPCSFHDIDDRLMSCCGVRIDDDYRISTVNSTNFNSSLHILNVNITEYLNPEKNVWLTLKAFNLLNKTVNVTQIYGDNFIQNIKTSALSRYFLLTVNFRLNKIQK